MKVPYMLIIGDKEVEQNKVTPRLRSGEQLPSMGLEDFAARVEEESRPEPV